ncbi:cysteine protease XCP1-like protein [Tanacetum coccineum]|uniref:Cysteine protease XCP1-like protein n=1 Tax=Tanacetum coccineum TaxID=301880 RepID=A0ABQ4WWT2_9ASTR
MTLFSSSKRSSFFVLFFALLSFSALAHEYSIVGYTPEDLTCIDKVGESLRQLKHIDETNKKVINYWLGLNKFADLSHEEFKNILSIGERKELLHPSRTRVHADVSERVTISGYHDVPRNNENSFLKALANQPISVAIDASGRDFQFYSGGVFDGHCGTDLDHGVAAVGYETSKGVDYITVRNSWGPKWLRKGSSEINEKYCKMRGGDFIGRMKRNTGKSEGICGLYKMASYPTKQK